MRHVRTKSVALGSEVSRHPVTPMQGAAASAQVGAGNPVSLHEIAINIAMRIGNVEAVPAAVSIMSWSKFPDNDLRNIKDVDGLDPSGQNNIPVPMSVRGVPGISDGAARISSGIAVTLSGTTAAAGFLRTKRRRKHAKRRAVKRPRGTLDGRAPLC